MAGEGMLLALGPGVELAVALAFAIGVEPEQFHFALRAIDESQQRFGSGATAGGRRVFGRKRRHRLVFGLRQLLHLIVRQVSAPALRIGAKFNGIFRELELRLIERQTVGSHVLDAGFSQTLSKSRMVEGGFAFALARVDQKELARIFSSFDLIPELRVAGQPLWLDALAKNLVF